MPSPQLVHEKGSGTRKAAILLLTLGDSTAREVFRRLSEEDLKQLSLVAGQLTDVSVEEVLDVLEEFKQTFAGDYIPQKTAGQVFQLMLERGLGNDRARALLDMPGDDDDEEPFAFCEDVDTRQLARVLQQEHPQTIAIVLSSIDPGRAAMIFEDLPENLYTDVVRRIAQLGHISPEVVREVSTTLREEFKTTPSGGITPVARRDGEALAVGLLKRLKQDQSEALMTDLSHIDRSLAESLRSKLFTFEDLAKLDSRSMQRLMREVDTRHLSVALRNADELLQDAFLSAISSRAAELLRDDMESGGPVRVADIEAAQQQVLDVALRLDAEGVLILPRGEL